MSEAKVMVCGASGRMGQELIKLLNQSSDLCFQVGVDQSGEYKSLSEVKPEEVDLVIDFTLSGFFDEIVQWCMDNKKALVSGTTGLSDEQLQKVEAAGAKIPIIWAPNMSIGIAMLNHLIQSLGQLGEEFDFQIEEFHHRHKKDKPSGTALYLQKTLENAVGKTDPPVAIRGGGIFGIHRIFALSEEETITLEHTALNRTVFARGALRAAAWLKNKSAGAYTLQDVLRG